MICHSESLISQTGCLSMKILIAEDDASSRMLLRVTLKKLGHEVTTAESGQEAWNIFCGGDYRVLITDWNMPDMNGLELCRRVRSANGKNYAYILLLTAYQGKESYIDAISSGADDFLSKPFDKELLAARLHVAERILNLQEALQIRATHDYETGIWNRAAILDFMDQELERAYREDTTVGVALADIDFFKRVNDTYGHLAGDQVLRETAKRMSGVLRPYDRIGRYGGEEFMMALPGCDPSLAARVAERIRESLEAAPVITPEGNIIPITCSIGITATVRGVRGEIDSLIREADKALYQAKGEGRNRVVVSESYAEAAPPLHRGYESAAGPDREDAETDLNTEEIHDIDCVALIPNDSFKLTMT